MDMNRIRDVAKSCGFEDAKYLMKWNGWDVYVPCFLDPKRIGPDIGRPFDILVKDEEIRATIFKEWQEILKKAEDLGLVKD